MTQEEAAAFCAQLTAAVLAQSKRDKDEIIAKLEEKGSQREETETQSQFLEFTAKEISKMLQEIRKEFRTCGLRAHIRKRVRGNSVNYEIRCRRQGYNISASGVTVEEAKDRFIERLNEIKNGGKDAPNVPNVPTNFDAFALYYFENYRKRKVTAATYESDFRRLKGNILPHFGNVPIKKISPGDCQNLIDKISNAGKGKTSEEVFSLLNCIFKYAIKFRLTDRNPLDVVIRDRHERQHGKALTKEEEKRLLAQTPEPYKTIFAIGLYTGLRPNEYGTIRISCSMIYARNSKRKNGKEETKRIPITPMLRPYLQGVPAVIKPTRGQLVYWFKRLFGNDHKMYDLRTTFYTRCKECGVSEAARNEFVGHSLGALGNAYTDLSDEYLKKEGEKLCY